jgi:hypothetical protein
MAEIIGESEQYVLDWFYPQEPPFSDEDAYLFLAHHGTFLSLYCKLKKHVNLDDEPDDIGIEISIQGRPIYFVVDSNRFDGKRHAIFWDGYKIFDPSPDAPEDAKLSDYKIVGFYPMMMTEHRREFFKNRQSKVD